LNSYVIRLPDGAMRFVSAASALAAAKLALGHASPRPPVADLKRPPDCFVRKRSPTASDTPFWRIEADG
jgi:hypothetical protein